MLAGWSLSVAARFTVSSVNSATVRLVTAASTGALFTSVTTIATACVANVPALFVSTSRTRTRFVVGPSASVGIQLKTPFVAFTEAPDGDPAARLKRNVATELKFVAIFVNVSRLPSATVRFVTDASALVSGSKRGVTL